MIRSKKYFKKSKKTEETKHQKRSLGGSVLLIGLQKQRTVKAEKEVMAKIIQEKFSGSEGHKSLNDRSGTLKTKANIQPHYHEILVS